MSPEREQASEVQDALVGRNALKLCVACSAVRTRRRCQLPTRFSFTDLDPYAFCGKPVCGKCGPKHKQKDRGITIEECAYCKGRRTEMKCQGCSKPVCAKCRSSLRHRGNCLHARQRGHRY